MGVEIERGGKAKGEGGKGERLRLLDLWMGTS